jgi:uncharacterized protein (DUF1499 family)
MMKLALVLAVLLAAAGLAYIRLAPSDPSVWHVDPLAAPSPGQAGARISPPRAPVFAEAPAELMARLDAAILADPRTKRLAGSVEALHATYIVRSRLIGFPDYASVRVLPEGEGATLAILARSRFGGYDWGTNRARIDRWMAALTGG